MEQKRRPNILILYTDQQRWDMLHANGNPHIHTPNLDRLAAEGVNFDHCFVQNPLCMPSRVSFLTGQYPSTLGITHMGVPVPETTVTMADLFGQYGYRCANIGKLHFQPHANRDHRTPHPRYGFDQLEISDEPGVYEDAYRAWVRHHAPDQLDHLSVGLPPATVTWRETMDIDDAVVHPSRKPRHDFKQVTPFPGDEQVTHTAFVADRTIDFLQRQTGAQPFLCIAGFYSPHAPWVVPQRFLDLYDADRLPLPEYPPEIDAQRAERGPSDEQLRAAKRGYYAMISEVDWHVGRILAQLECHGLSDNTVVVFTSDHGEWLGDHLRFGKGYPADDPVSRVPLIVRWPDGEFETGVTVNDLIEAVDVLPTLLDCAAIQPAPHLQGRSFYARLHSGAYAARTSALTEFTGWKTLRTVDFRYFINVEGAEQLWDLRTDRWGYDDVAADPAYQPILTEMRHLMLQRVLTAEQPLARTWPY